MASFCHFCDIQMAITRRFKSQYIQYTLFYLISHLYHYLPLAHLDDLLSRHGNRVFSTYIDVFSPLHQGVAQGAGRTSSHILLNEKKK